MDYEQGSYAGTWNQQALVVADQNVGTNFSTSANSAEATLQASLNVNKILADGQDPDAVRQQIAFYASTRTSASSAARSSSKKSHFLL